MKKILTALAVSAALVLPSMASAQIDATVDVKINDKPYQTPGTGYPEIIYGQGGGFLANFSIDNFPPSGTTANFNNYLIWCIDPDRLASIGSPASYTAYTAADFAATGLGSKAGYDVSSADMFTIAGLVSTLSSNWGSMDAATRADYQGSIWNTFRGDAVVPGVTFNAPADLDNWFVLYGNNGNQTFIFQVPSPDSSALLLFAVTTLGAMMFVRRRRA